MIKYKKVEWIDVREKVKNANKDVYELLQNMADNETCKSGHIFPLWLGEFSFGELLVKDGVLCTAIVPDAADVRGDMLATFGDTIPLALILQNSVEVFIEKPPLLSIPLNVFYAGDMFGVFEAAEQMRGKPGKAAWSISAGARSAVLVDLFDEGKAGQLKKTEFLGASDIPDLGSPKKDPWQLFNWIAEYVSHWSVEVLLIPRSWWMAEAGVCCEAMLKFQHYLLQRAWNQSSYIRIGSEIDFHIQKEIAQKRFRKYSHELHLRQIVAIASGNALGYEVAQASKYPLGPFDEITKMLSKVNASLCKEKEVSRYPLILQPAPLSELGAFYSASVFRIYASMPANEGTKPPPFSDFKRDMEGRLKGTVPILLNDLGAQTVTARVITPQHVPGILREIKTKSSWSIESEVIDAMHPNTFDKLTFFLKCVYIRDEDN